MKARDLAALAALGVVGYEAYNKFGKKGEKPSTKAKAKEASEDTFRSDAGMRPDAEMRPTAVKASRQENDIPEALSRQERDVPDRIMGRDAAGSRFTGRDVAETPVAVASPVRTPVIQTRSLATEQPIYDNDAPVVAQKPDATRVKQYNPDIMYADTVSADNRPASGSMNHLAYKRNQRAGVVPSQMPNDAAAARVARQSASASELASRQAAQAQTPRPTVPAAPPAAAPAATQNRYTKDQYGNIIDNVTGKVSRTIFSAGQEGNAARVGMKRGGAVKKMASGGLTSSRMSAKPKSSTASSRGDGIAQRGKTRGMMR